MKRKVRTEGVMGSRKVVSVSVCGLMGWGSQKERARKVAGGGWRGLLGFEIDYRSGKVGTGDQSRVRTWSWKTTAGSSRIAY